jgi:Abortive infection alpha
VRGIPEERRILPAQQIVGPVLEAIKYEPEETIISEMYNELLSRAFDRDTANEAHPAYVHLIRQLSVDEATILKAIYLEFVKGQHFKYHFTDDLDRARNTFHNRKIEADDLPRSGLSNPGYVGIYIEHLDKLGIAAVLQYDQVEILKDASNLQTGTRTFARYQLTAFGLEFMKAAVKT